MSDVPQIPPQRAKAALVIGLRDMADAVERGDVQYVAAVALYTPEGAEAREHAFDQLGGFPVRHDRAISWMLPLGVLRAAFLDLESHILELAGRTETNDEYMA